MRLAFLGPTNSYDFHKIGGTNSFIRRIAQELVKKHSFSVDYFFYGSPKKEMIHENRFHSWYFPTFDDAIKELENYDHVFIVYTPVKNLIQLKGFCRKQKGKTKIHLIYWDWPESSVVRNLKYSIYANIQYNGLSIAVSPRLSTAISKKQKNTLLLMPPVPPDYFISPLKKPVNEKIHVSFIGRIDIGKGIEATLDIFNRLSDNPEVELTFYGTYLENDNEAKKIHCQLSEQDTFHYIPVNYHDFSEEIDNMVRDAFQNTDIFIQPYKKLSSTIDMPVLVLEAMASLSAVITTPLGDIPTIYPKSSCIIPQKLLVNETIPLINSGKKWLLAEREKIFIQNQLLSFDTPSTVNRLLQALTK